MVGDVIRDFKYAIRSFVRRPLFTAVIVLTLALGIGSNVAMFSVANAVLLRALPYDHPEELALVWTRLQATNVERSLVSGPDLKDYQTQTTRFEGFAGAAAVPGTLTGSGQAERIMNGYTTWNLFELLGVRPLLGRTFRKDDAITIDPKQFANPNPDLPPGKVMLSYGLWQRRFGGDPNVIGRTIQMDGWGSVVVGVLPPTFRIYLPADAAMPTNIDAWGVLPEQHLRLRAGRSLADGGHAAAGRRHAGTGAAGDGRGRHAAARGPPVPQDPEPAHQGERDAP